MQDRVGELSETSGLVLTDRSVLEFRLVERKLSNTVRRTCTGWDLRLWRRVFSRTSVCCRDGDGINYGNRRYLNEKRSGSRAKGSDERGSIRITASMEAKLGGMRGAGRDPRSI